jgi:probable F420-dependent oxidoreductase
MTHKFRFGLQVSKADTGEQWLELARRVEELGFSTLTMPDHFEDQLSPIPALAAAGAVTKDLLLGNLVLDNDFKHPMVLAKEIATLDVLSNGRVEFGLGAGWMRTDYDQSGIPFDPPGVRISRMQESLRIIKGLFGDEPVTFSGKHYSVKNAVGLPKPVQKPHPRLLIGGGGKRVLSYAAREADIVSVNFQLQEGTVGPATTKTGSADATREKVGWLRDAAGDRFDDLELSVTIFVTMVTDDRAGMAGRVAPGFGQTPEAMLQVPHALIGAPEQIVDDLQQRRDEYGFSYIVFSGGASLAERIAPVVKKLAGT